MFIEYMQVAMRQAQFKVVPADETIYGEIPGLEGVNACAETLEACRHDLGEILEEWIYCRVSRQLPLPEIEKFQPPQSNA